jgi:transcriptional regulator with XRE-family HTH domain
MSKSPTKVTRRRSVKPCTDSQRTKEAFLIDLRTRARVAIDILSHHISQRQLEELLGLSQGYLSRLRARVSNPSAELVANLAMLCQDPPTRLLELERFWALPAKGWPPPAMPATRTALSPHRFHPRKPKGDTP